MSATSQTSVGRFLAGLEKRNPNEPEFLQAVRDFAEHVMPLIDEREELRSAQIKNLLELENHRARGARPIDDRAALLR